MRLNNSNLTPSQSPLTDGIAQITASNIQSPEQLIALIENEHVRDFVSLLMMGCGVIEISGRPMWAANAAKEIFEGIFGKLRPQGKDGEFYRLGFLVGLSRKLMPEIFNVEKKLAAFFANSDLMDLAMKMIRNESDISIADFHRGYADGILEGKQITPSTTLPVYAVFVIKWQEMAELKNVSQVVTLLETYLPSNLVGSRDRIAKLCQRIRFPLTDKGGRPKLKPRKA